jgi:low temperature requirement protein LtrA
MPSTPRRTRTRTSLLRVRGEHDSSRVGYVELFFDLVFVFAVTQLSHMLMAHLTPAGVAQVALLLLAVWWVWIYTSWATNWLDPERIPVRVVVLALMLGGLLLSVALPQAFEARGMVFAGAYVAMQVGRTLFFLWAVRHEDPRLFTSFQRICAWLVLSAVFWLVGATQTHDARFAWWVLALAIEMLGPLAFYWVPGLGRSKIEDWDIAGGHLAERCALFIIIALGESLLVTGATFAALEWTRGALFDFANAVLGTVLMWWIYFDTGALRATRRIERAANPGREGRSAYTYAHILIVAGIIVCAVADDLVLVHPAESSGLAPFVVVAGPLLFLFGAMLFKWLTNDRRVPPLSHLAGLAVLVALTWLATTAAPLRVLTLFANGALLVTGVWESLAIRRGVPQAEA